MQAVEISSGSNTFGAVTAAANLTLNVPAGCVIRLHLAQRTGQGHRAPDDRERVLGGLGLGPGGGVRAVPASAARARSRCYQGSVTGRFAV